jgi:hypothetical protein
LNSFLHPVDAETWAQLEEVVHRDPGGRRLPAQRNNGRFLDAGQLAAAAAELASAKSVAIVTGFCISDAEPPAAETDGPPGALCLARALVQLEIPVTLVCDRFAAPLLRAGCACWGLHPEIMREIPWNAGDATVRDRAREWLEALAAEQEWTHAISTERPGPSHTIESLAGQARTAAIPQQRFADEVPPEHRDVCHNMRGAIIDAVTAPLHVLFDQVAPARSMTTIGIADGGNEIGVGRLPWETVCEVLGPGNGRIVSRVATDYLLLGGVCDWAAFALAASVCALRGRRDLVAAWTADDFASLLKSIVAAGAVDGVSRRCEPTVDGLPLATYLSPLQEIVALLG